MPTIPITSEPIDLLASGTEDIAGNAAGLVADTAYTAQAEISAKGSGGHENFGGPYVHLDDGATAPAAGVRLIAGHKLRHMETARISGTNLWAWTTRGTAYLNVHEEP